MSSARVLAVAALAASVALSFAAATPEFVTIGTEVQFTVDGDEDVGTKKPKVKALYVGPVVAAKGDPKLKLKVTSFTGSSVNALVKKAKGSGTFDIQVSPKGGGEPFVIGRVFSLPPSPADVSSDTVAPKDELTITGTRFGSKKPKVFVNGKKAKTTQWSDTSVTVVVHKKTPAGDADVVVTNKVGSGTLQDAVTVEEAPSGGGTRPNQLSATTSGDARLRIRAGGDDVIGRQNPTTPVFTIEADEASRGVNITLSISVLFDPSTHTGNRTEITLNAGNGESFDVELKGDDNRFYRLDPAGNGTSATVTITGYNAATGFLQADLEAELLDADSGDRISFSGDVEVTLVVRQ